jgi:tetratricopeptide (TPR) repeat protein
MSFLTKLKAKMSNGHQPLDGHGYLERAVQSWQHGHYSAALGDFEQALRLLPDGPDKVAAYAYRARVYRQLEDWPSALADLDNAQEHAPAFGAAYAERAFILLMQGDNDEALVELDRAVALLPDGPERAMAYTNRGSTKKLQGDLAGALADYERAVASEPEFQPARERCAELRKQLAAEAVRAGAQADPNETARELYWRAQKASPVDQLALYTRILELQPQEPVTLYLRGVAHCKLGLLDQALDDLDLAIWLRPRFAAAITERGLALTHMGEMAAALDALDEALAYDPAYAIAHENYCVAMAVAGRWQDALAPADMAVRLEPRNLDYCASRGEVLCNLGRHGEAQRDLQAYLDALPDGPKAAGVRKVLSLLPPGKAETPPPVDPWPSDAFWREFVVLCPDTSVETLVETVQHQAAYYAVIALGAEQWAVCPVYRQGGLRERLTATADVIGPSILALRLEQIHDLWQLCMPVSPDMDAEAVDQAVLASEGRTIVRRNGDICGVLDANDAPHYPHLPTALFGPATAFDRQRQTELHYTCPRCQAVFAYFQPVLAACLLSDYACPACGASPVPAWIEERMQPNRWSQAGFLGPDESLQAVIDADRATLEHLGISHEQIAAKLDELLSAAAVAYQPEFELATHAFHAEMVAADEHLVEGVAKPTLRHDLTTALENLRLGLLPDETAGARVGPFQVLLQLYLGYQYCPFTVLNRPWSNDVPVIPIVDQSVDERSVILSLQMGLELPCRPGQTYRYAELDFLVINRETDDYLAGPGLIVHLIREHHFFEGPGSPYRVDPVAAARVLGLPTSPDGHAHA